MTSQAIVSLAILKANWDLQRRGYLHNFVPLVAESIKYLPTELVAVADVQDELDNRFGLRVPQHSLATILKRVRKEGYIRLDSGIYRRNDERLKTLDFSAIQNQVVVMYERLVDALVEFCSVKSDVTWSKQQAEDALEFWLQGKEISLISAAATGRMFRPVAAPAKDARYLVAAFVRHLDETRSDLIEFLVTVAKGSMLANAIFLISPDEAGRRFSKTEVYLDTTLLIHALGYAGQPRQAPATELLELLYETGADLRCFRHTVEEVDGILDYLTRQVHGGGKVPVTGAAVPSVEHFLAAGYTASDMELLRVRLERDIEALRVKVVQTPSFADEEYVIDESGLEKQLEAILYRDDRAKRRDVDSVAAVMRLRRGRRCFRVEECRAVFVTTNTALARECNAFFRDELPAATVFPCLTDYTLTNLLWLKKPTGAPDLPRKRLIADCYAATQPSDSLWHRYLSEIEALEKAGSVTADDYLLLRYSLEAKEALMELTRGGEDVFVTGTVTDMLDVIRARLREDLAAALETERKRREDAEGKAESAAAREAERQARILARAEKTARRLTRGIQLLITLGLLAGFVAVFPWSLPFLTEGWPRYVGAVFQLGVLVASLWNLTTGATVLVVSRWLEGALLRTIKGLLLRVAE